MVQIILLLLVGDTDMQIENVFNWIMKKKIENNVDDGNNNN